MKRVWCVLLLVAIFSCAVPAQAVTMSIDPQAYYTVKLKDVPLSDVLAASDGRELDSLLYPTGMQLPTKYLDLFMFANLGERDWIVTGRTYTLLRTFYPTVEDTYTFAECRTAQMFCGWYDALCNSERKAGDRDIAALLNLDATAPLNLAGDVATVVPYDVSKLQEIVQQFSSVLSLEEAVLDGAFVSSEEYQSLLSSASEFPYSFGYDYMWDAFYNTAPPDELSSQLEVFYNSRGGYCSALGLSWQPTQVSYFNADTSIIGAVTEVPVVDSPPDEELGLALPGDTAVIPSESFVPEDTAPPATSEQNPVPLVKPTPHVTPTIDYNSIEANKTISDFATGLTDSDATTKSLGWRDITVGIALCVILVAVITFGVNDWIKKRNDPTRRYRK